MPAETASGTTGARARMTVAARMLPEQKRAMVGRREARVGEAAFRRRDP